MLVVDEAGLIVLSNLQAERQFGYGHGELIGEPISRLIPNGFTERLLADGLRSVKEARDQQIGTGVELVGIRRGAGPFPIEIMVSPLGSPQGTVVTVAIRDITERRGMETALHAQTERAQVTLDSIGDAVCCTDIEGNLTFLNVVAEQLTGWTSADAIGKPLASVVTIVNAATREPISDVALRAVEGDKVVRLPPNCVLIQRDGGELPIEDSTAPIHDRDGNATGAVIVFHDVSGARAMATQLAHAAGHDFLTGLPNRLLLNDRIRQAITAAPRHSNQVAILFMDLDGFKHINDSLGHEIGDELLKSVAGRLLDCVRSSETVSRQGGDEFVALLTETDQGVDAGIIAARMLKTVAEVHLIDGHELHVTGSIGVSVYPGDGWDAETLLKNADTAMYQAKEQGRHRFQFFKPAMNVRAVERQTIEEGLRLALERDEFTLDYQPKFDLRTGLMGGAEALLRWTPLGRDPISPAQFIPIAEDSGLIGPIGNWALREACAQAQRWEADGLALSSVSVNVSAIELEDDGYVDGLSSVLDETGLDPGRLQLELTESALMRHAASSASILQRVRELGVAVAVDDFGTGYSSLSYLKEFPVDVLKIDQSFVRQITSVDDDMGILTAVISMARSLDLRVIAEGVETHGQWAFLKAHDCDEAQGFFLGRPVPSNEFATQLREGIPRPAMSA
jgi:diguanylate cyclase (GGDEF)-like protein/PAS domain S-box-containing protein